MKQVKDILKKLIEEVKTLYPELNIVIEYDEVDDYYEVWHDDPVLQFEDDDFAAYTGKLIRRVYKQGVRNFSFGYNHFKAIESKEYKCIESSSTIYNTYNLDISISESVEGEGVLSHPAKSREPMLVRDVIFGVRLTHAESELLVSNYETKAPSARRPECFFEKNWLAA